MKTWAAVIHPMDTYMQTYKHPQQCLVSFPTERSKVCPLSRWARAKKVNTGRRNWTGSQFHHKLTAPEFDCNRTKTTYSEGFQCSCFSPHPSLITVLASPQTNCIMVQND